MMRHRRLHKFFCVVRFMNFFVLNRQFIGPNKGGAGQTKKKSAENDPARNSPFLMGNLQISKWNKNVKKIVEIPQRFYHFVPTIVKPSVISRPGVCQFELRQTFLVLDQFRIIFPIINFIIGDLSGTKTISKFK